MVTVRALYFYPIKSLRGLETARAVVTDRGFEHDRRFMVVDATGRFLTQRTLPRMSLVSPAVDGDVLRLNAPGADAVEVPLRPKIGDLQIVDVWGDRCQAFSLGDAPARWFTEFLGVPCSLVFMPDASVRETNPAYGPGRVGFADAFPFLLTSTSSLADLAVRGGAVPMERFRPNIVVEGSDPFAEDGWTRIRIGAVTFRVVKPCVRCAITTVDPNVGAFVGIEPLRTLATFRRFGDGVLFGMNLVNETGGVIGVGATAEVLC
ncbi:MAG: MOSC domain-containing protein [Myxococcales bacterium]